MSNSAKERNNPPPRRKSCTPCIKAKRRCEYAGVDACLRCARRNVACDYQTHCRNQQQRIGTTPQRVTSMLSALEEDCSVVRDDTTAAAPYHDADAALNGLDGLLTMSPLDMDLGPLMADTEKNSFQFHGLDGFDTLMGLDNTTTGGLPNLESLPGTYDLSLHDSSSTPSAEDNAVPAFHFEHAGTVMAPATQQLGFVSTMIRSRLEFAVDLIRTAPRTMVERLEAPWSHRLLYQDHHGAGTPASMQDALGCCALYLAKNAANAPVVFSLIEARVATLLAAPPPGTLRLALAHAHALILYQVMRLFDGDVSARARGERLIPALEAATMHLLSFVRFDTHELEGGEAGLTPYYPARRARDLWHDWALHESARRTVLMTFYMLQAYRAMTGGSGQAAARCTGLSHSWTLSRGLWQAPSAVEFARVWREGRWFVVTNKRWAQTLREARAEDVDAFGRMWITALMGVEETEGWFAAKGGRLREMEAEETATALVC